MDAVQKEVLSELYPSAAKSSHCRCCKNAEYNL